MIFLTCPAYLDQDSAARCGLPAEVRCRFTMSSTDGPLDSVMIRCPAGHHFSGPVDSLTRYAADHRDPGAAGPGSRASRDSRQRGNRPNTAPAYYLGHPASLWITAMHPRRTRAAPRHLMEAAR